MATVEARVRSIWGGIEDAARSGDWRPRTVEAVRLVLVQGAVPGVRRHAARDPRGRGRAVDRRRARRLRPDASARAAQVEHVARRRSAREVRQGEVRERRRPAQARAAARRACMHLDRHRARARREGGRDAGRASPRPRRSRAMSTPSSRAARQVRLGVRLRRGVTSSPLTTTSNRPAAAANGSASTRNDDVTSAIGTPASCSAARSSWAPGCHGIPAATPAATRPLRKSTISSSGRSTPRSASGRGATRASGCPPAPARPRASRHRRAPRPARSRRRSSRARCR